METMDLIVGVVSAVALLLLLLNAVCDHAWSGSPEASRRHTGRARITAVQENYDVACTTSYREERHVWLVRPATEVFDRVPAEVQAEALGILDTLAYLDEWFAEGPNAAKDPPLT